MGLQWRGREVAEAVERAAIAAMNETLEAAADRARGDHPGWKTRTGAAERSIGVEPAKRDGSQLRGRVVGRAPHFPFLEHGTRRTRAPRTLERAGEHAFPELVRRMRSRIEDAK